MVYHSISFQKSERGEPAIIPCSEMGEKNAKRKKAAAKGGKRQPKKQKSISKKAKSSARRKETALVEVGEKGQCRSEAIQRRNQTPPTSPRDRVSQRRNRISRINMDGSRSFIEVEVEPDTTNDTGDLERSTGENLEHNPATKSNEDKKTVDSPPRKLAKSISKCLEKQALKHKQRAKFRRDPNEFLNNNASYDSLGDLSKSTIVTLYGNVSSKDGSPGEQKSSDRRESQSESSIIKTVLKIDDGDDILEEDLDLCTQRSISRANSSENEELFRAANTALEAYQRSVASRFLSCESFTIMVEPGTDSSDCEDTSAYTETPTADVAPFEISYDEQDSEEAWIEDEQLSNDEIDDHKETQLESNLLRNISQPETDGKADKDSIKRSLTKGAEKSKDAQATRSSRRVPVDADGQYKKSSMEINKASRKNRRPPRQIDSDIDDDQECASLDVTLDLGSDNTIDDTDKVSFDVPSRGIASKGHSSFVGGAYSTTAQTTAATTVDMASEAEIDKGPNVAYPTDPTALQHFDLESRAAVEAATRHTVVDIQQSKALPISHEFTTSLQKKKEPQARSKTAERRNLSVLCLVLAILLIGLAALMTWVLLGQE